MTITAATAIPREGALGGPVSSRDGPSGAVGSPSWHPAPSCAGTRVAPCAPVTCARQALGWGGLSTPRCPVPAAAVSFGSRLRCLKTPE